ncbi:hypothetical protein LECLMA074M_01450 [Leclercia sp. M-A074-M]
MLNKPEKSSEKNSLVLERRVVIGTLFFMFVIYAALLLTQFN